MARATVDHGALASLTAGTPSTKAPTSTTKPPAKPQQPSSNSAKRRPSGQLVPWHEASSDEESEYVSDGEFEDDSDDDEDDDSGEGEEQGTDGEEDGEGTQEGSASEEEVDERALALVHPHEGAEQITIKVSAHHRDAPDSKRVYALWDNVRAMQQVAPGSRRTTPGVFRLCDSNFVPVMEGGKPKFVTGKWMEIEGGFSACLNKYRTSVRLAEETVVDGKTYKAGCMISKLLPDAPGIPIKPRQPGQLCGSKKLTRPCGSKKLTRPGEPMHRKKPSARTLVGMAGMDEVERLRFRLAAVQPPLDKYTEDVSIEYHKYACRGENGKADKMYGFRGKLHRSVVELVDTLQALEKDQAPDGISASMEWMLGSMGLQDQGYQCCPARFYECLVKDFKRSRTASMVHVSQDLFSMNYVFVPVVDKGWGALAVICNPGDPDKRGIVYIQDGVKGFVVGQRLRVFWSGEQAWFEGTIQAINKDDGKYKVLYDDGDVQWEDLGKEKVELLPADSAPKPAKAGKTRAAKGRQSKSSDAAVAEDETDRLDDSKPAPQAGPDPNQVTATLRECLKREWQWSTAKAASVAAAAQRQRQQSEETQQEEEEGKPGAEGDQEQGKQQEQQRDQGKQKQEQQDKPQQPKQQQEQQQDKQQQQQQQQQQQEQLQLALVPPAPPLDDFSHTPLLVVTLANETKHHQTRGFVLACFHYMCKLASAKHSSDAGHTASDQAQPQGHEPDVIVVGGEQIVLGMDAEPAPMQGQAGSMDSLFDRLSWLKADGLVPSGDELIHQLKASFPTLQEFMDDWDTSHAKQQQQQQAQQLLLLEAPPPAEQQRVPPPPPQQPQLNHEQTNRSSQKKTSTNAKRLDSTAANDDRAFQQDQQQHVLDQPSFGSLAETVEPMDTDVQLPAPMQPYVDYIPASHETNGLSDSGTQDCGRHDGNGRQVTFLKKSVSSGFFITEPRGKKRPSTDELMKPPAPRPRR